MQGRVVERVVPPKAPFDAMNRMMRWLLSSPARASRVGQHLLVLHVTGRKSGRALDVPVAYREQADGRLLVLTNSTWRVNVRQRPGVEVTLRGRRRVAVAELVEEPERVARVYGELLEQVGHRRAVRELGVRVNVDRAPTHAELVDAVTRDRLALVYLRVAEPGA